MFARFVNRLHTPKLLEFLMHSQVHQYKNYKTFPNRSQFTSSVVKVRITVGSTINIHSILVGWMQFLLIPRIWISIRGILFEMVISFWLGSITEFPWNDFIGIYFIIIWISFLRSVINSDYFQLCNRLLFHFDRTNAIFINSDSIFNVVRPLTVEILDTPSQLVAERRYEIKCESNGSRPNAIITWYKGKRQLRRTRVCIQNVFTLQIG